MNFYTNVIQWGNNLLVREIKNGQRINSKIRYSPTLYAFVKEKTPYKTLEGEYVTDVSFDTIKEAKEWIENNKNQSELVYGNTQYPYTYISDTYKDRVNWDLEKLLMVTIDIEVQCENGFPSPSKAEEELLSITIKNHQSKRIVVWGIGDFETEREDVSYIKCKNEVHLLKEFLVFWEKYWPDIVTGWNSEFFDIPYICNRIKKLFGEKELKRLSPWGGVRDREIYQMGRTHQVYDIQGVAALDYFDLYRKFTYSAQESYRLDHIAFIELGERKEGNPYETFREWYTKDYQSFIEYNINDVELVDKLEDKMKLIELCLTMAYDAKVNYTDVLGSVRYWDILIYNYLREKNIVIPQKSKAEKGEKYEGAYVKDPIVGMHNWVMSFDLNSLYPHLIMQYNISPETLISSSEKKDGLVNKILNGEIKNDTDYCMTPNGAFFRKDKRGFLPEIMETMYDDRTKYKRLMLQAKQKYEDTKDPKLLKDISKYNNIQMAKKISLNSAYGAIGNNWFRYFNIMVAEGITLSGQLSIRWIEKALNIYLNKLLETKNEDYVIASDTDSVYITFDRLINKVFSVGTETEKIVTFLDKIATEKLEPFIDKSYTALAKTVNAYEQKMEMSREIIADKGIWTAKKRYILNSWDIEGVRYKTPQLKIMGIEAVKSSTPAVCRQKIKDALNIIMTGDEKELNNFIQEFRDEFMKLPPEDIAYPRSVNGLKKFSSSNGMFAKGAPIHCKGAILYNHLVKKHKLSNKYPLIQEGDKIKFLHMKQPNIYTSSAFSFLTFMPKELDIVDRIDYDEQFTKSFVEPLRFITEKILWKIDDSYGTQGTLEEFF
ncbi:MAG: DNA polymerase domain-containing protein [Candidatus Pacebacteria bacterium]|nr:DNA polymerase domain-containing protein [Candidatus Paceibacterota bacterium]